MREPERALGTAAWGIAGLDSALWPAGWPVSLLPRELQSLPGSPLQHELTAPGAFRGPTTRASSLSALPGTLDAAFPSAARFFLGKRLSPSLHFSSKPQTGGGGGAHAHGRSRAFFCGAPARHLPGAGLADAGSRPGHGGSSRRQPSASSPGTRSPGAHGIGHVRPSADGEDDSAGSCRAPKIMTKTISSPSSSLSLIISSEFN